LNMDDFSPQEHAALSIGVASAIDAGKTIYVYIAARDGCSWKCKIRIDCVRTTKFGGAIRVHDPEIV
jgi:hypothetical protein